MNNNMNDKQWAHKQAMRMVETRAEQTDILWVESDEEVAAELAFLLDQVDGPTYEEELAAVVASISVERELTPEEQVEFDAWDRAQEQSYYEDIMGTRQEEIWADSQ